MRWRLWTSLGIFVLAALFVLQNRERVELTFLFWDVELPRVAMLASFFAAGAVIGWISGTVVQLRLRADEHDHRPHEPRRRPEEQPDERATR